MKVVLSCWSSILLLLLLHTLCHLSTITATNNNHHLVIDFNVIYLRGHSHIKMKMMAEDGETMIFTSLTPFVPLVKDRTLIFDSSTIRTDGIHYSDNGIVIDSISKKQDDGVDIGDADDASLLAPLASCNKITQLCTPSYGTTPPLLSSINYDKTSIYLFNIDIESIRINNRKVMYMHDSSVRNYNSYHPNVGPLGCDTPCTEIYIGCNYVKIDGCDPFSVIIVLDDRRITYTPIVDDVDVAISSRSSRPLTPYETIKIRHRSYEWYIKRVDINEPIRSIVLRDTSRLDVFGSKPPPFAYEDYMYFNLIGSTHISFNLLLHPNLMKYSDVIVVMNGQSTIDFGNGNGNYNMRIMMDQLSIVSQGDSKISSFTVHRATIHASDTLYISGCFYQNYRFMSESAHNLKLTTLSTCK
jgi:hypothetical protein